MPKGGPRSNKPTALHVLQGTDRPDRQKAGEPRPPEVVGTPVCPPGLDAYGRQKWNQRAPMLAQLGLLTEADLDLFAAYCDTYAQWRRAATALRKLRPSDEDYRKVAVTVEKARTDLRLIGAEFGLSPASRSRLSIATGDEDDDPFEAWQKSASRSAS